MAPNAHFTKHSICDADQLVKRRPLAHHLAHNSSPTQREMELSITSPPAVCPREAYSRLVCLFTEWPGNHKLSEEKIKLSSHHLASQNVKSIPRKPPQQSRGSGRSRNCFIAAAPPGNMAFVCDKRNECEHDDFSQFHLSSPGGRSSLSICKPRG